MRGNEPPLTVRIISLDEISSDLELRREGEVIARPMRPVRISEMLMRMVNVFGGMSCS